MLYNKKVATHRKNIYLDVVINKESKRFYKINIGGFQKWEMIQ